MKNTITIKLNLKIIQNMKWNFMRNLMIFYRNGDSGLNRIEKQG